MKRLIILLCVLVMVFGVSGEKFGPYECNEGQCICNLGVFETCGTYKDRHIANGEEILISDMCDIVQDVDLGGLCVFFSPGITVDNIQKEINQPNENKYLPSNVGNQGILEPQQTNQNCNNDKTCRQIDDVWLKVAKKLGTRQGEVWYTNGWNPFDQIYGVVVKSSSFDSNQWFLDGNTLNEINDMDQKLQTFLSCMETKLPQGPMRRITSISDSGGLASCRDNWNDPNCAHEMGSAHYGCSGESSKSLAIDFGHHAESCTISKAAIACGASSSKIFGPIGFDSSCKGSYKPLRDHSDHLHVGIADSCS
jgi:hypothetical protein